MSQKNIWSIIIVLTIILSISGLILLVKTKPPKPLMGQEFSDQGREHVTSVPKDYYNSNPPTSGNHDAIPLAWKIYDSEISDTKQVHNLEHGGIVIQYKDSKDIGLIKKLTDLYNSEAKSFNKIILAPRTNMDTPIALTSWTRLEKLNSYDEAAIQKFIENNYGHSPESASV